MTKESYFLGVDTGIGKDCGAVVLISTEGNTITVHGQFEVSREGLSAHPAIEAQQLRKRIQGAVYRLMISRGYEAGEAAAFTEAHIKESLQHVLGEPWATDITEALRLADKKRPKRSQKGPPPGRQWWKR